MGGSAIRLDAGGSADDDGEASRGWSVAAAAECLRLRAEPPAPPPPPCAAAQCATAVAAEAVEMGSMRRRRCGVGVVALPGAPLPLWALGVTAPLAESGDGDDDA